MKHWAWLLILLIGASPAWCAKKITVGELEELLHTMQRDKKSDAAVATRLKMVELSEQLSTATMNSLLNFVPGRLSTEQIFVLEARSALLAPPAEELPKDPAPDAATQKAILSKAESYVDKTYDRLPQVAATKTTLRFQDNVETVAASSGLQGSAKAVVTAPGFSNPATFVHFINSSVATASIHHGDESLHVDNKKKTKWGANGMIALESGDPNLGDVMNEAQKSGTLKWLRWELVNGKKTAVFSFDVSKKKMAVNVCCFPKVQQAGVATFYTATTAATLARDSGGGGGGGVVGNFQTNTEWNNFRTHTPYHGRIYVNPETGIVVRMIVENNFKSSDFVHQLDTRIDYGPVSVGKSMVIAPVKSYILTEVVPKGDSGAGIYTTRHTFFTSQYTNYRAGKK